MIVADGQVTQGNQIVKPNVRKVRKIGDNVIGGFAGTSRCVCYLSNLSAHLPSCSNKLLEHAGATADAFTLFERLEVKLEEHSGAALMCKTGCRDGRACEHPPAQCCLL